jgi:ABC-type spermidine/putrescine transport system permease subunit I
MAIAVERPHRPRGRRFARHLRPLAYLWSPVGLLLLFFVAPLAIMFVISLEYDSLYTSHSGFTLTNYTGILTQGLYRQVAIDTFVIATAAMLVQFAIAVPLAYILAFRSGRFELPLLLGLVLSDQLNSIIRIYAWRTLLGRDGILNGALESVGIISGPITALLFSKTAVVLVLSTSWLTYTAIPIYAAMKAIDSQLFEVASDLGAGWFVTLRRILLPLAAPGIFIAILLVYIPLFTEFATPTLVGGTSTYMLGNAIQDLVLVSGDWGSGAALSFLVLLASGVVAVLAYFLAKLNTIDT